LLQPAGFRSHLGLQSGVSSRINSKDKQQDQQLNLGQQQDQQQDQQDINRTTPAAAGLGSHHSGCSGAVLKPWLENDISS